MQHLVGNEVTVFVAVDLAIALKDAMAGTGTHEVIITLAGRETAAHGGPVLTASFTTLHGNERAGFRRQPWTIMRGFRYRMLVIISNSKN